MTRLNITSYDQISGFVDQINIFLMLSCSEEIYNINIYKYIHISYIDCKKHGRYIFDMKSFTTTNPK